MSGPVTECALCGSGDLTVILDLGPQPLAERFYGHGERYPLAVAECGSCSLAQLTYAVDPAEVFPQDHPYSSGNSGALRKHFARMAHDLTPFLSPGDLIVDIGANDCSLLREFGGAFRRFAIEPTDQVLKGREHGVLPVQEFFSAMTAAGLRHVNGPARLITATNVLAHVPDPHDFAAGVRALLAGDGLFVAECHDLSSVVRGLQWDTCYHEHRYFWSVATLSRLLGEHGLEVVSAVPVATHGGSFRLTARPAPDAKLLQARASHSATLLHGLLSDLSAGHQVIYGIGATTRAVPLIHFARLAPFLACVCEVSASEKIGKLMPGTQIPVVDEAKLIADQPEYALILSHHMIDVIAPALRARGYRGKFISPLPEPKVLVDP